ncbi:MAG: LTA synthase family protein [Alistipes sp.]|nr:LTA synthase family protein [Alistipes sp.]
MKRTASHRRTPTHSFAGFCPAVALALRLGMLYLAWGACRGVFWILNQSEIGALHGDEIGALLYGGWVFDTVSILYINALFILLSLLPFRFREGRGYQRMLFGLFIITNALALMVNLSDSVYYHYAKKRFTADEFSYLQQNDNTGTVLGEALRENWDLLLFALCLIGLIVWGYRKIRVRPSRIRSNVRYTLLHLPALLLAIALTLGGIRGGFSRQTRPITLSNATLYTTSPQKANLILSNPFCILRTIENGRLSYTKYFDSATLDSLYTPYHFPSANRPSYKPYNVVVLILESFSSEHSALLNPDLYPDGAGYTPFLDSLMREGFYCRNAFANGHKSIEALPSVLASIPSYRTPFVLLPQAIAPMEGLPTLLKREGYHTSFFNGSSRGSMGFGAYAAQTGVEHYYSREDYEQRHGEGDFDGYWGIWDEPFLQYMCEMLTETPEPFFASAFTLTSHHPFVVPALYADLLPQGKTKIHKGIAYTDMALRHFMERARKEAWFAHTLFVFVADHVSSETFAPKTKTPTGNSHILCLFYAPDHSLRGEYTSVASQIDIMPTLLSAMGYPKPFFAFGRNLLDPDPAEPLAVNFMNENYQVLTDSMVLYSDGDRILSAYARTDTLQQRDLSGTPSPQIERIDRRFKARIQQYYEHVERGDFRMPDSLSRP